MPCVVQSYCVNALGFQLEMLLWLGYCNFHNVPDRPLENLLHCCFPGGQSKVQIVLLISLQKARPNDMETLNQRFAKLELENLALVLSYSHVNFQASD